MTHERATQIANVIIGVAAVGAVWYVSRTPSRRKLAWRVTTTALASTLPAWFDRELRQAWAASAPPRSGPRVMIGA